MADDGGRARVRDALRRVRFATDGAIYTLLPRDSVVLRQILGRWGVRKSLGRAVSA